MSIVLASLLTAVAASLGGPMPLAVSAEQAPLQRVADDEGDEGSGGCLFKYLCYQLPSAEGAAAEWLATDQIKYILVHDIALFGASFVGLPFAPIWMPFALSQLLVPEEGRPKLQGDLMIGMLVLGGIGYGLSFGLVPVIFLPFGFFVYLGVVYTWFYWVTPVTHLHLYNAALKEQGGDGQPKKKKKKRKKAIEEDEEY